MYANIWGTIEDFLGAWYILAIFRGATACHKGSGTLPSWLMPWQDIRGGGQEFKHHCGCLHLRWSILNYVSNQKDLRILGRVLVLANQENRMWSLDFWECFVAGFDVRELHSGHFLLIELIQNKIFTKCWTVHILVCIQPGDDQRYNFCLT